MRYNYPYRCPNAWNIINASNSVNPGLVFEKFNKLLTVDPVHAEIVKEKNTDWLENFKELFKNPDRKKNINELLESRHSRLNGIIKINKGQKRTYTTIERLAPGLGNPNPADIGFGFSYILGIPVIPGSSVKGIARSGALTMGYEEDHADVIYIFGSKHSGERDSEPGAFIFLDAFPEKFPEFDIDIINRHVDLERLTPPKVTPMDSHTPNPVTFLTVKAGTNFIFRILPVKSGKTEKIELAWEFLEFALKFLGAGGKTATGFGRFLSEKEMKDMKPIKKLKPKDKVTVSYSGEKTGKGKPLFNIEGHAYKGVVASGAPPDLKEGETAVLTVLAVLDDQKRVNLISEQP